MTWHQAHLFCMDVGGYLAEIDDAEEQSILEQVTQRDLNHWIGAADFADEGHFRWQHSYQPVSYTHWQSGEPNNRDNQDCVLMLKDDVRWNDFFCEESVHSHDVIHALCEGDNY